MALIRRNLVREHPTQAGLLWALLFVPLFVILQWAFGRPVSWGQRLLVLIAFAILGGQAWGYLVQALLKRRGAGQ